MTNSTDSCSQGDEENTPICPECGCREMSLRQQDTTKHPKNSPWSFVETVLVCKKCNSEIPQHVAERWCGASEEDSRKTWREEFRDTRSIDAD